mmetsp:Transcript_48966/g.156621  ORF Transcript_48966/g.156621 Transcript_48966/m.156621 type:complete len:220 (+) Transcript_48966:951-1610(+)
MRGACVVCGAAGKHCECRAVCGLHGVGETGAAGDPVLDVVPAAGAAAGACWGPPRRLGGLARLPLARDSQRLRGPGPLVPHPLGGPALPGPLLHPSTLPLPLLGHAGPGGRAAPRGCAGRHGAALRPPLQLGRRCRAAGGSHRLPRRRGHGAAAPRGACRCRAGHRGPAEGARRGRRHHGGRGRDCGHDGGRGGARRSPPAAPLQWRRAHGRGGAACDR